MIGFRIRREYGPAASGAGHLPAVAAVLLLAAAAARAQTLPPAPVVVAPVLQRDIAPEATFVATVMPSHKSIVGSAIDERVTEFLVNEGDPVAKDQPLVQLRTKTIEIELAAARAERDLREQELAELKNGSRPEEIAQAKATLLGAEAKMTYAKSTYGRCKTLFESGRAVSQDELDQARSDAVQAEQLYLDAKAAYALAVAGPRKEKIAQAEARLLAQTEEVHRLEDLLAKHTIRSPLNGYVIAEHTEVGQWVTKGSPVAEVVDIDPVEIRMLVPEADIARLRAGMPARVTFAALPNEPPMNVHLTYIVPQADVRSRTFPVTIRLANPKRDGRYLLQGGMLARVTVAVGRPTPALVVPKDAIVLGGPKPAVFVVEADPKHPGRNTARRVPVEPGTAVGGSIQVAGPLKAGQKVVVGGNERLRPGQPVRIVKQ